MVQKYTNIYVVQTQKKSVFVTKCCGTRLGLIHYKRAEIMSARKWSLHTTGCTYMGSKICYAVIGWICMSQGTTDGPGRNPPPPKYTWGHPGSHKVWVGASPSCRGDYGTTLSPLISSGSLKGTGVRPSSTRITAYLWIFLWTQGGKLHWEQIAQDLVPLVDANPFLITGYGGQDLCEVLIYVWGGGV